MGDSEWPFNVVGGALTTTVPVADAPIVMPGEQPAHDWEIIWYDDEYHKTMKDGGDPGDNGVPDEDIDYQYFERLSRVEAQVQSVRASTSRIEEQLGNLSDTVDQVDNEATKAARFRQNYKDDIEANKRMTTLVKWGGGILILMLGAFLTLVELLGLGGF